MRKGFTLVEVLAVIVILGLLVVIISPVVNNLLGDSEDALYDKQVDSVINGAKKYVVEHSELLPEEGGVNSISIAELINEGVIDNDKVINPKTKEQMNGCVVINYNNDFNQYEYNYSENKDDCIVGTFDYVGYEQTYMAKMDGYYKLETWGAQGGTSSYETNVSIGGYGGYSTGEIFLSSGTILYITVGGKGQSIIYDEINEELVADNSNGYNGGGYGNISVGNSSQSGGGGATHVGLKSGILKTYDINNNNIADVSEMIDILIVSGGGGGSSTHVNYPRYSGTGGHAGGFVGNPGEVPSDVCYSYGVGGNQTEPGTYEFCTYGNRQQGNTILAGFGFGSNKTVGLSTNNAIAGGGSGFYGGFSGCYGSGGGGSGYIGNSQLINNSMYCYNCQESSDTLTRTISTTGTSALRDTTNCPNGYSENPVSKCAKSGNGYARITYLGESID